MLKNLIHSVDEHFFRLFDKLRQVNLNENLLRSINTLYFNSNYLGIIIIESNKLEEIDRFVFLNPNKTSINNLIIKLGRNYLNRLPKLYGNVYHINTIFMNDQKGSMTVLGDYFFDNSVSFKYDNNVNRLIICFQSSNQILSYLICFFFRSKYYLLMLL